MQKRETEFIEALSEVRVFLAIETIFGIPWLFLIPVMAFSVYMFFHSGLVLSLIYTIPVIAALWIFHKDDDRGLIIFIQNVGSPKTWHAGFGSERSIVLKSSPTRTAGRHHETKS